MLVYMTGTENQKRIENAIYEIQMEHTISIGEPIRSNSINLLQEVKSTLCKNKDITTLLIDLSVITNSDTEIIQAVKTLRFYNNDCRFIIVATEREIGDTLLSELVNMGIYNIVIDEDDMISKISHYTLIDGTYKEASVFQIIEIDEEAPKKKIFSKQKTKSEKLLNKSNDEKIIIKPLKQKIIISIIGTQNRIGVTHSSITLAYSLMKKGYRVAVVELNNNGDLKYLVNCYEHNNYQNDVTNYIKIYQIDLYPRVDIETLSKIQGLNYDYIIIDNGTINDYYEAEHNKADVKLVCFGTRPWEQHYLSNIFALGEETIKDFRLITVCNDNIKEEISEELKPNKVYFPKYNSEPFSEDEVMLKSIEGFLFEENKEAPKKKGIFSFLSR